MLYDPLTSENSRALLASIVDSSDDAIVSKTLEGVITSWNAGAERLFGYTAHEVIGRSITILIPPELLFEETHILSEIRAGRRIHHFETIRRTKDGRRVEISLTVSPVRDASGKVIGASKIARDIGARRSAEAARALLAAIVESSDDAIVSKTPEGIITSWNGGAERLFGYSAQEAIGQSILLIIPSDRLDEERRIISSVMSGQRIEHFDTVRRRKDGQLVDISLTVSPVRDTWGRIVGASKVARDITDRRRIEGELQRYRTELEIAVSERTAALEESSRKLRTAERAAALGTLAAGFGHDMANLLLPIFARLDAIEAAGLTAEVATDLNAVRAAAGYLQRLASGLRLMAMDPAEAGAQAATDLQDWWEDVDGVLQGVLPRGVKLVVEGIQQTSATVAMPRHRLTQAVFNLVQNAGEALATQAGGEVRISAAPGAGPESRRGVLITVQDNGPGMTEEVRRRCFEPYFSTKGRAISTGMGLSLVRGLVRGAGGTIELTTEPGAGTTFTIWLPIAETADVREEETQCTGTVSLEDPATAAFVVAILDMLGCGSVRGERASKTDTIWVADTPVAEDARQFLRERKRCIVIVDRDGQPPDWAAEYPERVLVATRGNSASLRKALTHAASRGTRTERPAQVGSTR